MNTPDAISAADEAEERWARDALRSAASKDDLIYAMQLRRFGLMGLAG